MAIKVGRQGERLPMFPFRPHESVRSRERVSPGIREFFVADSRFPGLTLLWILLTPHFRTGVHNKAPG